ncbi:MAG: hypothetical protein IJJ41_08175 [Clostridia bacterium]|nr:hypothetical protein [Clostridia bacterium]
MKRLIAYYSASGGAKFAAEQFVSLLDADMLRVDTVMKFPKGSFGKHFVGNFMSVFNIKPVLKKQSLRPTKYDEIIICSPVWAGKCAPPMLAFLHKYDFTGKKLYYFATSYVENEKYLIDDLERKTRSKIWAYSTEASEETREESTLRIKAFSEEILQSEQQDTENEK